MVKTPNRSFYISQCSGFGSIPVFKSANWITQSTCFLKQASGLWKYYNSLFYTNSKTGDKTAIVYLNNRLCNNLKVMLPLKRQYSHRFITDKTRKSNGTIYRYCKYLKPNQPYSSKSPPNTHSSLYSMFLVEIKYTKLYSIKCKDWRSVPFQHLNGLQGLQLP